MKRAGIIQGLRELRHELPMGYHRNAVHEALAALSSPCACGGREPIAEITGWMHKHDDIPETHDVAAGCVCRMAVYGYKQADNWRMPVRVIILPAEGT